MSRRSVVGWRSLAALGATVFAIALSGCSIVLGLFAPTGTVSGVVWDATTGLGIEDVAVTVVGRSGFSTTTDQYGSFELEVPAGTVVIRFALTGYQFSDTTVTVTAGETTAVPYGETVGNPPLVSGSGAYRFVLTWGERPYDLDSHLLTPNGRHVYFGDEQPDGAGANLDVDDTTSFGPETITITTPQTGTYRYYVHNYSEDGGLTTSGAQVRVYDSGGLVRTFSVPTSGTGEYWNVFTLSGTTVTPVNQIVAAEPSLAVTGVASPRIAK